MECLSSLDHPIVMACFEDYGQVNARSGKITCRAETIGILKWYFLQSIATPIIMLSPNALKSFATGDGHAKKEDMMHRAAVEGFIARCSDEADAYFAAKVGQRLVLGERVGVTYTRVNP